MLLKQIREKVKDEPTRARGSRRRGIERGLMDCLGCLNINRRIVFVLKLFFTVLTVAAQAIVHRLIDDAICVSGLSVERRDSVRRPSSADAEKHEAPLR